jgi:transitional endoplasmic reticulum ATPase
MRRARSLCTNNETESIDPIIRLWILRMLVPLECRRQLIGIMAFDSEEIALLFALPGCSTPSSLFDEGKARQKLHRCHQVAEKRASKFSLPKLLADNIKQLADLVGLSDVECQLLGFAIILNNNRLLNEVSFWLGRELGSLKVYHVLSVLLVVSEEAIREALAPRSVLSQTALLVLDRDYNHDLSSKLNLLSNSFADRLMTESGSPVNWLRDMIVESPEPHLLLDDYSHIKENLDFLLPYLQQALSNR